MNISRSGALIAVLTIVLGGVLAVHSEDSPQKRVGPLPDGGFLLNSGWVVRPAGTQVPVDTFPMSQVTSADGKYLIVLNGGYNPPSLSVIDTVQKKEVGRTPVPDAWLGLTMGPNNVLYVGGGARGAVYEFALDAATGSLTRKRDFPALTAGIEANEHLIGDIAITPDAHILYAADVLGDSIAVINLQSGRLIDTWKCARRPYRVLLAPGASEIFVSSWADGTVAQYDANSGKEIARTRVGPHATDMLWVAGAPATEGDGEQSNTYTARLFVAASGTNNVYSLGVTQDLQLNMLEAINISLTPLHPLGMTPSALAISKDGSQLLVVCSDANAVALADISGAHAAVLGFIPTGWYPTAVHAFDNGELSILNGKGKGSRANPDGPVPGKKNPPGYIPHMQTGTVSLLDSMPQRERLRELTAIVMSGSPYRDEMITEPISDEQQAYFAKSEGHASPIQHVIYIIKENRTYDQVFGDMEKGNGDKSLNLFGEQVTPNQHQLARDFVLYDNFYENADVSAEGHNWANAAIAPDYTVKTWPSNYADRKKPYDYEGGEPANTPPAGYIWDNALQAGLTVRDYGEWTENVPGPAPANGVQIGKVLDPALHGRVDMDYRGWDLDYPDVNRAHEFLREWKNFDANGNAPNLMIVRLGNNHTEGTRPGKLTPFAMVADNDYALGTLVDGVSHSNLWPSTAIFVIEDDAQNGCDHVDSHRAPALLISPYTRRGIVDSTMYNQMSLLRTIEMIVGLHPLTHFDAGATPMFASFSQQMDSRPYTVLPPRTSLTERNAPNAVGAAVSQRMDFSEPDRVDDNVMNAVLWQALKGGNAPPPTRSAFSR